MVPRKKTIYFVFWMKNYNTFGTLNQKIMKKLLLGAILTLGFTFGANAQVTITATNFPNNVIPAGWTQQLGISIPNNKGWQFSNTVPGNLGIDYMPASGQGYFALVDDYDNNPASPNSKLNNDTLYTGVLNCSAYTSVFISFDIWYQGYYIPANGDKETVTVAYSTDGGHTWGTAITNPYGAWTTLTYDISSYVAGHSNVKIAFTYTDDGAQLVGMGLDNVKIYSPAAYNVAVLSQNLPGLMQVGKAYTFSGVASDSGSSTITSMNMNYYVNSPSNTVTQTISGISGFTPLTTYNWSMNSTSSQFTPPSPGLYTVKYWASKLNGSNANTNTDTLTATFWAVGTVVTRQSVYEEFTGQSCVFCMTAAPNVDTVFSDNSSTSNIIRYHVPIPGRDFMYNSNTTPIQTRENYYSINSAPSGNLDGASLYPGGDYYTPATRYSSITVQGDNAVGSPISIKITKSKYVASKDSFEVSADITAYTALPAGLTAQVVLTIDSITYKDDLSEEDPKKTFAPPIGQGINIGFGYPNAPDSYYQYVIKFTHVAEELFPNTGSGTSLSAFTPNQTQTISFAWKQDHPWSQYPKGGGPHLLDSTLYDSSSTGQFVVFVQSNNAIPADAVPSKYIFQSAAAPVTGIQGKPTAVESISNGVDFKMYPNPTNSNATLAFNLDQDQNVTLQVYNMLGESVYSDNEGILSSGQHTLMINGSNLNNGVYLVKLTTDNGVTIQRLVIQK